jgi:hypothetical protein
MDVFVHDAVGAPADAQQEHGMALTDWDKLPVADACDAAESVRE